MEVLYEPTETNGTEDNRNTKKCPFCAEVIQYEAIKCKHCHEFLDGSRPAAPAYGKPANGKKWIQSTPALIVALLTAGPFALPLVWVNPRYSKLTKTLITVGVLVATVALCYAIYQVFMSSFNQLKAAGIEF